MITIIGAGLGGLALAQGLMRRGHACQVLEQDADASSRAQGFRISLNALGREALRELLPPERHARILATEAKVGRRFAFARTPARALLEFDADAWTVCRPLLRAILAEDVPIRWGTPVETPPEGELVVGADGVGSRVRAWLSARTTVPEVFDTGVTNIAGYVLRTRAWEGRLPLNARGAVQYLGPEGQTLFVSFCERDDRTPMVLWALSARGEAVTPAPGWHPVLQELMQNPTERGRIRSSRFNVPKQRLHAGVTLLGDAAHAMPPQRGLGGNNAFEDARLLCARLDDIGAYEREMFTRAKVAIEESEEAAQLMHLRNPITRGLRNAALAIGGRFASR